MSTLVLPEPQRFEVEQVAEFARLVVEWAETIDDITIVRDAAARWGAITEYVRRTSNEGVAEAEGALRRLEVRIGKLLGPAVVGRPTGETLVVTDISADARHDLRVLAEHADIVEEVIAASSDKEPPSRRKCLNEITRRREAAEVADAMAEAVAVAPRLQAALAALPPKHRPDWRVVLRFRSMHVDDVRYLLPNEAEIVDMTEDE